MCGYSKHFTKYLPLLSVMHSFILYSISFFQMLFVTTKLISPSTKLISQPTSESKIVTVVKNGTIALFTIYH